MDKPPDPDVKFFLALQGGGARGMYEVGAYTALHETGVEPTAVSAISSGALNAAVICGNEPRDRIRKLNEMWGLLTAQWVDAVPLIWREWARFYSIMLEYMGKPGFYAMRPFPYWMYPPGTPGATSYYTNAPLLGTLQRVVNLAVLNSPRAPALGLGVTNVESGELEFLENRLRPITFHEIMATAALPPGSSAVRIGPSSYWDGGVAGNSPMNWYEFQLHQKQPIFPKGSKIVFIVIDLFQKSGRTPMTLLEAQWRKTEIDYSSDMAWAIRVFRATLAILSKVLDLDVHIVQLCETWASHPAYYDCMDFSPHSLNCHWASGYHDMQKILRDAPWNRAVDTPGAVLHKLMGGELISSLTP